MAHWNLAIEQDDTSPRYGSVHAAGCSDLRDPEPVKATSIQDALMELWDEYEDAGDGELSSARMNCAKQVPLR